MASVRSSRQVSRGFTLVELMIVVAIIGVLAAIAMPAFSRYVKKSRTAEAAAHLNKMWQSSVAYFEGDQGAGTLAKQFPDTDGTIGTNDCCSATSARCPGNAPRFNTATWQALNFAIPEPHNYYPTYTSAGLNENSEFLAGATGDLDCDDIRSTFRRHGTVNGTGEIVGEISGSTAPTITNELE
jgi:prepilin-type N-terminal cleavage/methylation domain-containing protein